MHPNLFSQFLITLLASSLPATGEGISLNAPANMQAVQTSSVEGSVTTASRDEEGLPETRILLNFAVPADQMSPELKNLSMQIVNDGVMGGLSLGKIKVSADGTAVFSGTLSLENNGGFSSVYLGRGAWDLHDWKGIEMKIRGDGRTYDLRLETDELFRNDNVNFRDQFKTESDSWITVQVPFSGLRPSWRGRQLNNRFDPAKIESISIVLADKQEGPFQLEIAEISAYR